MALPINISDLINRIDWINKELLQKCNLIEPRYIPIVEQAAYEGKEIIVLWIPGGADRPYKCPIAFPTEKNVKSEKEYYIRKMSNSIRANQLEEKELFMLANNQPYDDRPNPAAKTEDLKTSLISEFLYAVKSDLYERSLTQPVAETAVSMRLIGGPSEWKRPLNAGLMFFNERPDDFFPYARIEVVDKPDPTGIGMTEKIFMGPLDRQLRDALSYIKNYIIKERVIKLPNQAEAVRIFNLPYAAVEESLSNAIYHKSYQIGEPITITVTPDRMEITSLPGPDRTISNDDLQNRRLVSRRYRNRRIGDFLKELKLVEGRNTGIPTILHAMEANGSDMPLFETDEDRTYFTVILPVHKKFLTSETAAVPKKRQRRSLEELKELVVVTLTEHGNLPTSELASELGYTKVTSTLSKALKELMMEGTVKYLEQEKVRSRNQKVCLAEENSHGVDRRRHKKRPSGKP